MGLFKKKGETTPNKPLEVKPPKKAPREDINMGYQSDQASPAHSEEQAIAMQTFSTNVSESDVHNPKCDILYNTYFSRGGNFRYIREF